MSTAVSPLAVPFPDMPPIAGVAFATAAAGIKYKDRRDVFLALFQPGTTVAGVFTRSKCPSAPVDWCRAALAGGSARALVVNSGNANAFTGKQRPQFDANDAQADLAVEGCRTASPGDVFHGLDRRDRRAARRQRSSPRRCSMRLSSRVSRRRPLDPMRQGPS